ncbi:MAG: zf-TFIIB domain-containing protein [Syntrophales bacterium]
MNCPTCNVTLQISERQGIEIDYCPQCRGIWLDRGELDKIIERAALEMPSRQMPSPSRETPSRPYPERHDDHKGGHYNQHHDEHSGDRYHKKKSFLSDLFD